MRYLFVKRYNPAYDFFLIQYFRDGGIEFGENTAYDEADRRELFSIELTSMTPQERLFCGYVRAWRMHPECRPSLYYLLEKALTDSGIPDLRRLMDLESQLPSGRGKLLYTKEEAAADISEFYKKYLRIPLKQDIENGSVGKELTKYFAPRETNRMPFLRVVGQEKFDEVVHTIAGELLAWLSAITPEKVVQDVDSVLEAHEKTPDHMRMVGTITNPKESSRFCTHESEYVELTLSQITNDASSTLVLKPGRGLHASDYVVGPGWDVVVFPWYQVFKEEWQEEEILA